MSIRDDRVKESFIRRTDRIIASITSEEIICVMAHRAPVSAYLEFEAQPDHKTEYTARLEVARIIGCLYLY